MRAAIAFLPMRRHGEGDHPKGDGGVNGSACASYPSTMLRMVPLPIACDGEELA
jgi:hypothetical protein